MSSTKGRSGNRGGLVPRYGRRNRNNLIKDRPYLSQLEIQLIKLGRTTKGSYTPRKPKKDYRQVDTSASIELIERAIRGEKVQPPRFRLGYHPYPTSYF